MPNSKLPMTADDAISVIQDKLNLLKDRQIIPKQLREVRNKKDFA